MNRKLLIVGAGGHGRCCLDIARENVGYNEICFLDDQGVGNHVNGTSIIDYIKNLQKYVEDYDLFVAIGNNIIRKELIEKAEKLGFCVITLISNKSVFSEYASIEKGSVIFPGAVVEANAVVGKGSIIAANATINHDAVLEDYVLVNSNTVVRPNTRIGCFAKIGSHCVITFGKEIKTRYEIPDGSVC